MSPKESVVDGNISRAGVSATGEAGGDGGELRIPADDPSDDWTLTEDIGSWVMVSVSKGSTITAVARTVFSAFCGESALAGLDPATV